MRRKSLARTCLLVGGAYTSALAIFHFFLPSIFRWADFVQGAAPPIWAFFAMNFFLSFLMLWGGLSTILVAVKIDEFGATARFVLLGMAGFWIINAAYQGARPPPFPAPLRIGFLALAIVVALLYLLALIVCPSPTGSRA